MIAVVWWRLAIRFRVQDERQIERERRDERDERQIERERDETRDLIIMASQAREIKEIHFGALKIIVDGGSLSSCASARASQLARSLAHSRYALARSPGFAFPNPFVRCVLNSGRRALARPDSLALRARSPGTTS